jgi:hypothetical protein
VSVESVTSTTGAEGETGATRWRASMRWMRLETVCPGSASAGVGLAAGILLENGMSRVELPVSAAGAAGTIIDGLGKRSGIALGGLEVTKVEGTDSSLTTAGSVIKLGLDEELEAGVIKRIGAGTLGS